MERRHPCRRFAGPLGYQVSTACVSGRGHQSTYLLSVRSTRSRGWY